MADWGSLLGNDELERAEHGLTLRRTLAAIGWAAAASVLLLAAFLAVTAGVGAAVTGWTFVWVAFQYVGALVLGPVLAAGALWVLRRSGRGRPPRVLVGAAAGLLVGFAEQLLFTGMSPVELVRTEPDTAFLLLGIPLLAGAAAGWLVGPRPDPKPATPSRDDLAEDSLLE